MFTDLNKYDLIFKHSVCKDQLHFNFTVLSLFVPELAAEFIARPQNQEVVEGEKAEFACSVSKDTYEVKWFRGDKEVEAGDKYTIISEGKRRALIVKDCKLKDEGGYVAHIGNVRASADLYVIGKMIGFSTSGFFKV